MLLRPGRMEVFFYWFEPRISPTRTATCVPRRSDLKATSNAPRAHEHLIAVS